MKLENRILQIIESEEIRERISQKGLLVYKNMQKKQDHMLDKLVEELIKS
jgi:hypothetical protein